MADESETIHEDIVATRQDLEEKLELLRDELRRKVDVKAQIGQHPWLALGGSIAVGFALGRLGQRASANGSLANGMPDDPARKLRPSSLLVHVGFVALTGLVHQIIERQVPKVLARVGDRMRNGNGARPRDEHAAGASRDGSLSRAPEASVPADRRGDTPSDAATDGEPASTTLI